MDGKRNSLRVVLLLLGAILIVGTTFFSRYLDLPPVDAFYLTVMTVATVGYGDVSPLLRAKEIGARPEVAELFTVLLIFVGMGILAYGATLFTEYVVSGDLQRSRWKRTIQKRIDALRGHYVVCGGNEMGVHILQELSTTRRPFVVVEENAETVRRLEERWPGLLLVHGDPGDEAILALAGVERCDGVMLALPDERENLMITLAVTARCEAAGVARPRLIARVVDLERTGPRLLSTGADGVISTGFIGGRRMVSELTKPQVTTFLDRMLSETRVDVRIEEVRVGPGAALDGATLAGLALPDRLRLSVLAVKRGEHSSGVAPAGSGGVPGVRPPQELTVNPDGEFKLRAHDTLIVLGEVSNVVALRAEAEG